VFAGQIPQGRPEDAHDIIGTFRLVNDPIANRRVPTSADDLIAVLQAQHSQMLSERPDVRPGQFKERPNRAGDTVFVAPELVRGTLTRGYEYYATLPAGFARAVFVMFLVSEVHPFDDGNGRIARVMMNSELTAVSEQRVIVPTVYRDDYLQALRALSRGGRAEPIVRVIDFAQQHAAAIDWSELNIARSELAATHAFEEPDGAARLKLP
jgi:fido (protein-threonine AMPylation protein)